jgi:MoaA/NifB/PqqE/SkfB family radical SAM enzyme
VSAPSEAAAGVRLQLAVARSCFVRCRGCYNNFSHQRDLVSCEQITAFLRYCRDCVGVAGVTLCGGDPLTRPDILELVDGIRSLGIPAKLDTVGTAFLGPAEIRFFGTGIAQQVELKTLLSRLRWLSLPLDGWDQDSVSRFRAGRPELFEETLRLLELLHELDTPVGVNTVVTRLNLDGLAKIRDVLAPFRIAEWQLFEYRPSGPLSFANRDDFRLPRGLFEEVTAEFVNRGVGSDPNSICTAKDAYEVLPSRLVVDSDGLAWSHLMWVEPPNPEPGPRRIVAGNIRNPADYEAIVDAAVTSMKGRIDSEGRVATTDWMASAQPGAR